MKTTGFIVNVTSEDPERLKKFYSEIVQLPPNANIGEGAFEIAPGSSFIIDGHSDVRGQAKEPARMLINFFVDNLAAEQARLKSQGVKFIREEGKEYWGGVISTFLDPDGNYCQLIQYKPE
ncbi:MAG TPA: VOC family protein [Dehalococcoidia bacterium]|jgi:predicted enzyme related to lactoylglutathione lyase|nr:VOC family protein [Dehalococcoidia bacterium]